VLWIFFASRFSAEHFALVQRMLMLAGDIKPSNVKPTLTQKI